MKKQRPAPTGCRCFFMLILLNRSVLLASIILAALSVLVSLCVLPAAGIRILRIIRTIPGRCITGIPRIRRVICRILRIRIIGGISLVGIVRRVICIIPAEKVLEEIHDLIPEALAVTGIL